MQKPESRAGFGFGFGSGPRSLEALEWGVSEMEDRTISRDIAHVIQAHGARPLRRRFSCKV